MKYNKQNMIDMDQRYRAHFINSLSGYKSANVIGTRSAKGDENACIVSSVIHLGADPALLAFINRPHTVERHTLENIIETGWFTINQVARDHYKKAHQTSARYPRDVSEFEASGLTVQQTEFFAPYVKESPIKLGMRLVEKMDIHINNTVMLIGQVEEIHVQNSEWIEADGKINIDAAQTVCVSGLDEYHWASSLGRLPYAKP